MYCINYYIDGTHCQILDVVVAVYIHKQKINLFKLEQIYSVQDYNMSRPPRE